MPTLKNGKNLRIHIGGVAILYATTCTLSVTVESESIAHKDVADPASGNWAAFAGGQISATLNHSGFMGSTGILPAHWTQLAASTEFAWTFTDGVGNEWSGNGFFSGLSLEATVNQKVTYEFPIQVTGEVLYTAIV